MVFGESDHQPVGDVIAVADSSRTLGGIERGL
jgi:hypothetical protein